MARHDEEQQCSSSEVALQSLLPPYEERMARHEKGQEQKQPQAEGAGLRVDGAGLRVQGRGLTVQGAGSSVGGARSTVQHR